VIVSSGVRFGSGSGMPLRVPMFRKTGGRREGPVARGALKLLLRSGERAQVPGECGLFRIKSWS